jgi:hypothetical protein
MGAAPLSDALDLVGTAPVITVGRTLGPGALVGGLPGLLARGLGAAALVVAIVGVGRKQLLTMPAFALSVSGLHGAARDVPPPEEDGKPRRGKDAQK